jgi:hypothetical protein
MRALLFSGVLRALRRVLRFARFALSLVGLVATVRADISPTQFIGSGIAARSATAIRMEKAKVEIEWGMPCTLSANFTMVNSTGAPQKIRVGFPMPAEQVSGLAPIEVSANLTMTFDGKNGRVTPPSPTEEDKDIAREWVWFHCEHEFQPGATTVVVKTRLRASRVYATAFSESLFYCIETGGNWDGTIGEEEVIIRFPDAIEKDQIAWTSPAGFQIEGNSVRWRFVNFKPKAKEFDVELQYVRPDAMKVIASLRREVERRPGSTAAAVKLARHLLVLGFGKSNSGYPPSRITKEEYARLLVAIGSRPGREIFIDHYRMNADGGYEETTSEWTKERVALIQILADAGYRDEASRTPFVVEAERLLKDAVARDPKNAEAWNVYLANYWCFSFAALGHWFGPTRLSEAQAKLIDAAARNCPDDDVIREWLVLRRTAPSKWDLTELRNAIDRSGFFTPFAFPKVEYGYY